MTAMPVVSHIGTLLRFGSSSSCELGRTFGAVVVGGRQMENVLGCFWELAFSLAVGLWIVPGLGHIAVTLVYAGQDTCCCSA